MSQPGVPFIGSKISLISRNDIRYEGTLYTIDTKEHTVALSNGKYLLIVYINYLVKSLGTENRRPSQPIPPSDEVVDYVIFRSDDIKDLHVAETTTVTQIAPAASAWPQQQMQFGQFGPYPGSFVPQAGFAPPYNPYMMMPFSGYVPPAFQQQPVPPQQQLQQLSQAQPGQPTDAHPARAAAQATESQVPSKSTTSVPTATTVATSGSAPSVQKPQGAKHDKVTPQPSKQHQGRQVQHTSRALPGTGQYVRTRGHAGAIVGQDFDFDAANQAFDKEKMLEDLVVRLSSDGRTLIHD